MFAAAGMGGGWVEGLGTNETKLNTTVAKLQLNYDALFEARNEFAPANLPRQDEKVLVLYRWCKYINSKSH